MIAVAPAEVRNRWQAQPCDDVLIDSLEHARFGLSAHAGHGCDQWLSALRRSSEVCA